MGNHEHSFQVIGAPAALETDPVCGMQVAPESAAAHEEFEGRTYYFCNPRCAGKFRSDPTRYAAAVPGSTTPDGRPKAPRTAIDPVCGMQVAPESAAAHEEFEGRTYYFCNL